MRNLLKTIVPFATAIMMAACGNDGYRNQDSKKATAGQTPYDAGMSGMNGNGKVVVKDDKLNAIYPHYVHLTTALINGDAADAKIASNAIEAGAKEMDGGQSLATHAARITSAANIEAQRVAFAGLSDEFIERVKKSGLNSGWLYVDYCPMALNNKGAFWLSSYKEIRNPYFGESMMTCGEVKRTIK